MTITRACGRVSVGYTYKLPPTSGGTSYVRSRSHGRRVQAAVARRHTEDGIVSECAQPDGCRAISPQWLRLVVGRHAARAHGLRKTFGHAFRGGEWRREIDSARGRIR